MRRRALSIVARAVERAYAIPTGCGLSFVAQVVCTCIRVRGCNYFSNSITVGESMGNLLGHW